LLFPGQRKHPPGFLSHYILCVPITEKTRQKGIDRVSAWRSRFAFQRLLGNGVFINRETLTAAASLSDGGAESAT
jgi:hypothetical protein